MKKKKKKANLIFRGTTKIECKQKMVVQHVPIMRYSGVAEVAIRHM